MSAFGETHGATVAEAGGADTVADKMPRCSCLPFCFWRGSRSRRTESRGAEAAALGKRRRRRRRRFRLSWSWLAFAWPWLRRSGKKHDTATKTTTGKQRRGRQLLLLLKTSLQAKKALASVVVSGDSAGLLPATVSSFSDAKKQNRSKPRPTPDGTAPSGARRQPQPSTTAMLGTGGSKAPARPGTNQPCTTATPDDRALVVAGAGRIWRDPSRRCYSLRQPDRAERPRGSGLWTAATTLGVIVLFGRVTAVVFLCSCLYGARFVWLRLPRAGASASAKSGGGGGGSGAGSSRRFGDPVGVAAEKVAEVCVTEESKNKVVMAGLLERPGQRPSSRFGR